MLKYLVELVAWLIDPKSSAKPYTEFGGVIGTIVGFFGGFALGDVILPEEGANWLTAMIGVASGAILGTIVGWSFDARANKNDGP